MQNQMLDKMELARKAIHIEQVMLKENVGCQDQVIAAVGGLQKIDFMPSGEIHANPITIGRDRLEALQDHILLYFTGFSRIASTIVKEQLEKMPDRKPELKRMREMVDESVKVMTAGDLSQFGRMLDESWMLKRSLSSKISTPAIDEMYEAAKSAGALGGKLLGAGGGGFMIVFAKPEHQPKVKERLKKLLRIPFRFENEGSHILLYQPENAPEKR